MFQLNLELRILILIILIFYIYVKIVFIHISGEKNFIQPFNTRQYSEIIPNPIPHPDNCTVGSFQPFPEFPRTLSLSIRSSRRLEASLWHISSIALIPKGSCVEDRWEPPGNPSIRLQISNRVKQWLDTGKWHGLEITIRIPNDGPKRERRDPRAIGERWVTIRWRLIYIYSLDEISLGWPPRGYRHSGIVIAEPGRSSHLASIHELSSGSLSIFERRGDSRFN